MTGDPLTIFLRHNVWATRVLLDSCDLLSHEQFHRRFDMGPGSLHATLTHIIGAMLRWSDRIPGREVRPSIEGKCYTVPELRSHLERAASELNAAILEVSRAGKLDEVMEFKPIPDQPPLRFTRGAAVAHVLNHGSHHRAQVINMLKQLGQPFPEISPVDWQIETELNRMIPE